MAGGKATITGTLLVVVSLLAGVATGFAQAPAPQPAPAAPQNPPPATPSPAPPAASPAAPAAPPATPQTAPPTAPSPTVPGATQTGGNPVGSVATLQGAASVTHNNADAPLHVRDTIYKGDVLQTSTTGTLGVTFDDETTFTLTPNSRIAVDDFVYQQGGANNAGIFNIVQGTVAFVAHEVAKTGTMKIDTPNASLGIRGTSGLVQIPPGGAATAPGDTNIKLYPDADGHVGRIDVLGRDGAQLGVLTRGASGFAIRPGPPGAAQRFSAVPLQISPQEAARDRGLVRQTFAARTVGSQFNAQRLNAQPNRPGQPNRPNPQNLPRQNQLPRGQQLPGRQGQTTPQSAPAQQRPGVTTPRGAQPLPSPAAGSRPGQQGQSHGQGAQPPAAGARPGQQGQQGQRGQGAQPPAGQTATPPRQGGAQPPAAQPHPPAAQPRPTAPKPPARPRPPAPKKPPPKSKQGH